MGVAYIERWPRFERYKIAYLGHGDCPYPFDEFKGPVVCPEQDGMKRWPDAGETVELTAHVWNFGDTASGPFDYEWKMDDALRNASRHDGLKPGEHAKITLSVEWPADGDNPTVTFAVDMQNEIDELIEDNNVVVDWIKGYTLGFFFSPEAYESLTLSNDPNRRIQSPEHWVHNNVAYLNKLLDDAGLDDRVRAELFFITEDVHLDQQPNLRWYMDGIWRMWHQDPADPRLKSLFSLEGYKKRPDIEHALLHELMHQLGVIDLYQMFVETRSVLLPDANRPGQKAGCGSDYWPHDYVCFRFSEDINDLMGNGPLIIGAHTAGGLKVNAGHRRGHYGEYLYDTPDTVSVRIVNKGGQDLPNVALKFYQYEHREAGHLLDAIPEFEMTTDGKGIAVLPNRGITGIVTATGHQLRPNPFGVIDVVGTNGIFVIEMQGPCTNYGWLTLVELNLAYWAGLKDHAMFTKTLHCPPPQSHIRDCGITGFAADQKALITLYDATDGANWVKNHNWLSNAPLGEWYGVKTDENGCVAHLDLHNNELTGKIPMEMGNLLNLRSLTLDSNHLSGEIPVELENLTNLRFIRLSANQLTGKIPPELGRLSKLEQLEITANQLTGEIPPELGNLSNLYNLRLYANRLTGPIPETLGNLVDMKTMHLHNNELSGEIPAELGNLVNLIGIELHGNPLTGCIPAALRNVDYNDFSRLGLPFCE